MNWRKALFYKIKFPIDVKYKTNSPNLKYKKTQIFIHCKVTDFGGFLCFTSKSYNIFIQDKQNTVLYNIDIFESLEEELLKYFNQIFDKCISLKRRLW